MDTTAFEQAQRRLMRRYQVEASSRFIDIDGPVRRAHVLEWGSGPPVLLVHGGGSFAGPWAPLMAQLVGYRLIAIDRPGHGLSDPFVYQKDIDIIRAYCRSLRIPTPLFEASLPYYTAALRQGWGMEDTAAIHAVLRQRAGLRGTKPHTDPRRLRRTTGKGK